MEFDPDKDGMNDLEDNGYEDEEEDDVGDEPPLNLLIFCQQAEDKKPCMNTGKCVIFDQTNMLFKICEHLRFDEPDESELECEET